jgi:hypothetical protein
MSGILDRRIDSLYRVLPAKSYADIARKLTDLTGDWTEVSHVATALAHLRRCAAADISYYGWTVPHVKRGPNTLSTTRLFSVDVHYRGNQFTIADPRRISFNEGNRAALMSVAQQMSNQCAALELAINYEQSESRKAYLRGLIRDITYLRDKTHEIVELDQSAAR